MFELTILNTIILAILVPVLSIGLPVVTNRLSKRECSGKMGRFSSYVRKPIVFKSLDDDATPGERKDYLKKQIAQRLLIVYLFIGLFILSNVVGTFYQIIADHSMCIIDPGFAPREWIKIIFESPFNGGWSGSFAWYGQTFLPPAGADIYHETWSWIFFSASLTDDTTFFIGATRSILIFNMIFGLIFLLPLANKSIRKSFLPSLFLFFTGMSVITRGLFGCFGQAWSLEFGDSYLRYGIVIATRGQLMMTTELTLITFLLPVIVIIYGVFLLLGRNLWRIHYPENKQSVRWLLIFMTLHYWISLLLIMNI